MSHAAREKRAPRAAYTRRTNQYQAARVLFIVSPSSLSPPLRRSLNPTDDEMPRGRQSIASRVHYNMYYHVFTAYIFVAVLLCGIYGNIRTQKPRAAHPFDRSTTLAAFDAAAVQRPRVNGLYAQSLLCIIRLNDSKCAP